MFAVQPFAFPAHFVAVAGYGTQEVAFVVAVVLRFEDAAVMGVEAVVGVYVVGDAQVGGNAAAALFVVAVSSVVRLVVPPVVVGKFASAPVGVTRAAQDVQVVKHVDAAAEVEGVGFLFAAVVGAVDVIAPARILDFVTLEGVGVVGGVVADAFPAGVAGFLSEGVAGEYVVPAAKEAVFAIERDLCSSLAACVVVAVQVVQRQGGTTDKAAVTGIFVGQCTKSAHGIVTGVADFGVEFPVVIEAGFRTGKDVGLVVVVFIPFEAEALVTRESNVGSWQAVGVGVTVAVLHHTAEGNGGRCTSIFFGNAIDEVMAAVHVILEGFVFADHADDARAQGFFGIKRAACVNGAIDFTVAIHADIATDAAFGSRFFAHGADGAARFSVCLGETSRTTHDFYALVDGKIARAL